VAQLVIGPQPYPTERHEFSFTKATQDALVNYFPVLIAVDNMFNALKNKWGESLNKANRLKDMAVYEN